MGEGDTVQIVWRSDQLFKDEIVREMAVIVPRPAPRRANGGSRNVGDRPRQPRIFQLMDHRQA